MKRSELNQILYQEFFKMFPEGHMDRCVIEAWMERAEFHGMVPPAIKEPCPTHYIDSTGQVQRGEDSFTFVHRWEDE